MVDVPGGALHGDVKKIYVLAAVMAVSLSAEAHSHSASKPEKFATSYLDVAGRVRHGGRFSISELKAIPSVTLLNFDIVSKHGTQRIRSLKGVLLKNLLDRAEIENGEWGGTKKMYIVASASDGYKAVFSWSELFNSPLGEGVIVGYERDGQEISDNEGKLVLVSAKDTFTGARYVKWLQKVEVRKISK